jgi:hypothetical protein
MVDYMKKVAKLDVELTVDERNLLSVGYKNVIGARRAAWRILSSIEQKEESKGNETNVKRIKDYRGKVEEELTSIANDILNIIDTHLIPSSNSGEFAVFYHKMYVSKNYNLRIPLQFVIACPCFELIVCFSGYRFLGKETISDTLQSSRLVKKERRQPIIHKLRTKYGNIFPSFVPLRMMCLQFDEFSMANFKVLYVDPTSYGVYVARAGYRT